MVVGDAHRERGARRAHGQLVGGQVGDLVDVVDAAAEEAGGSLDLAADGDWAGGEQPHAADAADPGGVVGRVAEEGGDLVSWAVDGAGRGDVDGHGGSLGSGRRGGWPA